MVLGYPQKIRRTSFRLFRVIVAIHFRSDDFRREIRMMYPVDGHDHVYPLVTEQKYGRPFLWPFSIAMLVYHRVKNHHHVVVELARQSSEGLSIADVNQGVRG